jgi:hypothetical protein
VALNFTVVSEGVQFDRLAVMYLGDIEVWRMSTAEPKKHPGIRWTYWKDMTTYLSLWKQPQTLIFDLGNIVSKQYTGVFNATLTATFFDVKMPSPGAESPVAEPAPTILSISAKKGKSGVASAFRYPEDKVSTKLSLPKNAVRAVVSISATGQADEEFWWANPPDSVVKGENDELGPFPSSDSFREVRLLIDGQVAGATWPYPVVFTGGISPPLHRPLVGIQAFDLLESEVDITPWLGILCDGKDHEFSMKVVGPNESKVSSHWVVTGKVFVYQDAKNKKDTTGPPPNVVITSPDVDDSDNHKVDSGVNYTQTARRTIEISAPVTIRGQVQNTTWQQRFSMSTVGMLKDRGNYQFVRAIYEGESRAIVNNETFFYNGFSYPIESTIDTEQADGITRLQSDLYQGMDLTITGKTVFSSGIEAFLNKLDRKVSGSTLTTTRNGTAVYFQNENGSTTVGDSMSHQLYRFGARRLNQETGQDFDPFPLLYSRDVEIGNEQRITDRVSLYRSEYQASNPDVLPPSQSRIVGDFAPLPDLEEGGGIKMMFGKNVEQQSKGWGDKRKKNGGKKVGKDGEDEEEPDKEVNKGKGKNKNKSKAKAKTEGKGGSRNKDTSEEDDYETDDKPKSKSSPVKKQKDILNELLDEDEVSGLMDDIYEEVRNELKDELLGHSDRPSRPSKSSGSGKGFHYSEEELENMKEDVKNEVIEEVKDDIKNELKDSMRGDNAEKAEYADEIEEEFEPDLLTSPMHTTPKEEQEDEEDDKAELQKKHLSGTK